MKTKFLSLFVVAVLLISVVSANEFGGGGSLVATGPDDDGVLAFNPRDVWGDDWDDYIEGVWWNSVLFNPGPVLALIFPPKDGIGPSLFARIVQNIPLVGRFVTVEEAITVTYGTPRFDLPQNYLPTEKLTLQIPIATNAKTVLIPSSTGKLPVAITPDSETVVTVSAALSRSGSGYILSTPLTFELGAKQERKDYVLVIPASTVKSETVSGTVRATELELENKQQASLLVVDFGKTQQALVLPQGKKSLKKNDLGVDAARYRETLKAVSYTIPGGSRLVPLSSPGFGGGGGSDRAGQALNPAHAVAANTTQIPLSVTDFDCAIFGRKFVEQYAPRYPTLEENPEENAALAFSVKDKTFLVTVSRNPKDGSDCELARSCVEDLAVKDLSDGKSYACPAVDLLEMLFGVLPPAILSEENFDTSGNVVIYTAPEDAEYGRPGLAYTLYKVYGTDGQLKVYATGLGDSFFFEDLSVIPESILAKIRFAPGTLAAEDLFKDTTRPECAAIDGALGEFKLQGTKLEIGWSLPVVQKDFTLELSLVISSTSVKPKVSGFVVKGTQPGSTLTFTIPRLEPGQNLIGVDIALSEREKIAGTIECAHVETGDSTSIFESSYNSNAEEGGQRLACGDVCGYALNDGTQLPDLPCSDECSRCLPAGSEKAGTYKTCQPR